MEVKDRISTIDFVRGIAILSVILLHTISEEVLTISHSTLHIGQAVPLFLFVSFYLAFKGLDKNGSKLVSYYNVQRIKRLLKQVVLPFVFVVIIQSIIRAIIGIEPFSFNDLIAGGARGPGSYYFVIYIQIWLIIPLVYVILHHLRNWGGGNYSHYMSVS